VIAMALTSSDDVFVVLAEVRDPEIPALSVIDMAIVRDVSVDGEQVVVKITPTYSGCPAMKVIEDEIVETLKQHGAKNVSVETVLAPAWTTDWMSEEAKRKLKESGIAPPCQSGSESLVGLPSCQSISCPYCDSASTELLSEFGTTACKALYRCQACGQPFDYFKAF